MSGMLPQAGVRLPRSISRRYSELSPNLSAACFRVNPFWIRYVLRSSPNSSLPGSFGPTTSSLWGMDIPQFRFEKMRTCVSDSHSRLLLCGLGGVLLGLTGLALGDDEVGGLVRHLVGD